MYSMLAGQGPMIEAPACPREPERLSFLRALRILDTPIEERFERITRLVCTTLRVPIAAISLVDERRQWFKSIAGIDVAETPRDISFCGHAILRCEPMVVPDSLEDERFFDNPLVVDEPFFRFYAGYPLTFGTDIRIGTLCAIDRIPREISEDQLAVLSDLGKVAESEITNAALCDAHRRLVEELEDAERAALIDPLSRLWNRAGGERLLECEWQSARRSGKPISIAFLDIDDFKGVNDRYGHQVGDEVLKHFARVILSGQRPYDIVSRWGGEEFVIAMPGCDERDLLNVLERRIKAIRKTRLKITDGPNLATASIGACTAYPSRGDDLKVALKRADRAMYAAKNAGRNRYVVDEAPDLRKETRNDSERSPETREPHARIANLG